MYSGVRIWIPCTDNPEHRPNSRASVSFSRKEDEEKKKNWVRINNFPRFNNDFLDFHQFSIFFNVLVEIMYVLLICLLLLSIYVSYIVNDTVHRNSFFIPSNPTGPNLFYQSLQRTHLKFLLIWFTIKYFYFII